MSFGKIQSAEGYDKIKALVQEVLFRKKTFVFFSCDNIDPVSLKVETGFESNGTGSSTTIPTENELKSNWEKFFKFAQEKAKDPWYAVYDFGYFVSDGNFRSTLVLFSYIPNNQKGKIKMVYSTNVQSIKDAFNIPFLIQANDLDDINRDRIIENITRIQITF